MGMHDQDACFLSAVWCQWLQHERHRDGQPGYGFMIWHQPADWSACWVESSSLSGLQRAERPLCPWVILPCALGLAARYIKTGASVTESALWKLRGLADGHFWRCRSIIKMKSSDWARPGMLYGTEELLSLLLISTLALHLPLSFCLSQVTEV